MNFDNTNRGVLFPNDKKGNEKRPDGNLARARAVMTKATVQARPADMWRYRELLPVQRLANVVTLGEGMTPLAELPEALKRLHATQPSPTEIHVNYRPSSNAMREILDVARECRLPVADIRTEDVALEDIFLQLTGAHQAPGDAPGGAPRA